MEADNEKYCISWHSLDYQQNKPIFLSNQETIKWVKG